MFDCKGPVRFFCVVRVVVYALNINDEGEFVVLPLQLYENNVDY